MSLLKELLEMNRVDEGAGMDAQRRAVRQVAGVIKHNPPDMPRNMHRADLKKRAKKMARKHGTEFTDGVANLLRRTRKDIKGGA